MIIGIDFDGVIADTPILKIAYVNEHFNKNINIKDSSKEKLSKIIGIKNYKDMITNTYISADMLKVPPVKDSLECIKRLSKKNKILIVTSRNDKEVIVAKRWLKKHKVNYNLLINTSEKNKSDVCKRYNIDVLIEDEPKKLDEITLPNMRKILLKRAYNNIDTNSDIIICKDWNHVVKVLESQEARSNQKLK
jgi:uncharacterized HAD superfamily protein